MKSNNAIFTFVALATTFQMYTHEGRPFERAPEPVIPPAERPAATYAHAQEAQYNHLDVSKSAATEHAPQPISPDRKISARDNIITATEGSVAITFEPSTNKTNSNELKGKITDINLNNKTSSSTIAANISKQLKKPLTISEQSLLTKAFDLSRKEPYDWNHVNKALDTILYQSNRTGENLTEHNLLDALKSAEKTGTFTDIYNKIMSACGSFFTPGPVPKTGMYGKVHYKNGKLRPTYTLWETLTLPDDMNYNEYTQIPYSEDIKQKTKIITFSDPIAKANLANADKALKPATNVGFEENPQPINTQRRSITADPLTTNPQPINTPVHETLASKASAANTETIDSKIAFAPVKIRKPVASKTQETANAQTDANKRTAQSYNTQDKKTVEETGFIV